MTKGVKFSAIIHAVEANVTGVAPIIVECEPRLYNFALGSAAGQEKLECLQALIDCRRNTMGDWDLQGALSHAAKCGKNASVKLLLHPGNRELNPQLDVGGRGIALYYAATERGLSHVPDLVESDADISHALRCAVIKGDKAALEKLLKWVVDDVQPTWTSNPYVVPVEMLVRRTISEHRNVKDWKLPEIIPVLCEHFSEMEVEALQEDPEVGTIVRDALKGSDHGE